MTPRIVAFAGPMGSGKTTAAKVLVRRGWTRMSFADPIREMLRALGVSDHYLFTDKTSPVPELCGRSTRYALQELGTGWGREKIGERLWLDTMSRRLSSTHGSITLDDVRFDNEARVIREVDGWIIELSKPGAGYTDSHASERGIDPALVTHHIYATNAAELELAVRDLLGFSASPI